jgi:hypothetical protein
MDFKICRPTVDIRVNDLGFPKLPDVLLTMRGIKGVLKPWIGTVYPILKLPGSSETKTAVLVTRLSSAPELGED